MSYDPGSGRTPEHWRLDQFDPDEVGKRPLARVLRENISTFNVRLVFGVELVAGSAPARKYPRKRRTVEEEEEEEEEEGQTIVATTYETVVSKILDRQVTHDIMIRSRQAFTLPDFVSRIYGWPRSTFTLLWVDVYAG